MPQVKISNGKDGSIKCICKRHMKILITGGAGFIGSALIRHLIADTGDIIVNVDKLTYAANLDSLQSILPSRRYFFEQGDICDRERMAQLLNKYQPDAVMHLAAETHVDRSIDNPEEFITTNIIGTYRILECVRTYFFGLSSEKKETFRFHFISTDEVYGSLQDNAFSTEADPFHPNSPYASSKAAAEHIVRAWNKTYGLPTITTNCSNNFGPFQFPEKLIPLMIIKAIQWEPLPIYGTGDNIRDWLYVDDHARALRLILEKGVPGENYNVSAGNTKTNLEIAHGICDTIDHLVPPANGKLRRNLITFVQDRPGHDKRYALDARKLGSALGWKPVESFESALQKTIKWYIDHEDWWRKIFNSTYDGHRLGVAP